MRKLWLALCLIVGVCASSAAEAARVEARGDWLYVDGEPFLVKGIGYSPYRPGTSPWVGQVSLDTMAQDFEQIRQAGFNTIRTWTPLSAEQLALARQHGLMVLQGIWVDPKGNYDSDTFRSAVVDVVHKQVERLKGNDTVLAVIIGNEFSPARAALVGIKSVEEVLRLAAQAAKQADPTRLVTYSNWPLLSTLDVSMLDIVGFNVYPYEPIGVSYSFGYRGYIEHLKTTLAHDKPLLITETGLSVSPKPGAKPGYGGNTPETQARDVVKLLDSAYDAGAAGACVFEWNDEWWKRSESRGDERVHDENDPEEWFGITEFLSGPLPPAQTDARLPIAEVKQAGGLVSAEPVPAPGAEPAVRPEQLRASPRPAYGALQTFNQAILVTPASETRYQERIVGSVYAEDVVGSVRFRIGKGKWLSASQVSPHWWRAQLPVPKTDPSKPLKFVMEARDKQGKVLVQRERSVFVNGVEPAPVVTIQTEAEHFDVGSERQFTKVVISVADTQGAPMPNQPVMLSIAEPVSQFELTHEKQTDEHGRIEVSYPIWDAGLVMFSAAVAVDNLHPTRRVGAERSVVVDKREDVAKSAALTHQPSVWEQGLPEAVRQALAHAKPAFQLFDPGTEAIVDYARYGRFVNVGTPEYRYDITDQPGLAKAVGEGIYPNEEGLIKDPAYRRALEQDLLEGNIWDLTYSDNPQIGFLRWAGSSEEAPGVKQFFTAMTLERAGLLQQAVKAYYAVIVHYPGTVGWTEFKTPWYVGKVARDKIEAIVRLHPELGLRIEGAHIDIDHAFDNIVENDVVHPFPGQLVRVRPEDVNPPTLDLSTLAVKREIGRGRVRLRQFANNHWRLLVDNKPWVIRGMSYQPSAVGQSPDDGTLQHNDWMTADRNKNGLVDGPFDTFVDANRNNKQDPDEPTVGDFQLMKNMGVNTIRLYHHASNKELLRQLYDQYGIMVLMGDFVGMYTVGSGAKWEDGTDYLNPEQRKRMTESVKQMVREFKKEPYILMWVLGNENNYGGVHGIIGGRGNASQHPREYYAFLNELATWIHQEDPNHPVMVANGEWLFVDVMASAAPAIDVFGANVYRGDHGFGRSFFDAIAQQLDRPVVISEFGCPAYQANRPLEVGELGQAMYHLGNWVDLADNMAGRGTGNAIGGVVFEFVDEWWKAGQPPRFSSTVHETVPNWSGPFPGGKNYEEWFGITSQGDGTMSPFLRQLRLAYFLYQQLWKTP